MTKPVFTHATWTGPYFVYLDGLRESGKINMFEAPKYLRAEFGLGEDIEGKRESFRICKLYMAGDDPDSPRTDEGGE